MRLSRKVFHLNDLTLNMRTCQSQIKFCAISKVDKSYRYGICIRKTANAVVGATAKTVHWESLSPLPSQILRLFRNSSKKVRNGQVHACLTVGELRIKLKREATWPRFSKFCLTKPFRNFFYWLTKSRVLSKKVR